MRDGFHAGVGAKAWRGDADRGVAGKGGRIRGYYDLSANEGIAQLNSHIDLLVNEMIDLRVVGHHRPTVTRLSVFPCPPGCAMNSCRLRRGRDRGAAWDPWRRSRQLCHASRSAPHLAVMRPSPTGTPSEPIIAAVCAEAADQDPNLLTLEDGSVLLTSFSWNPMRGTSLTGLGVRGVEGVGRLHAHRFAPGCHVTP